MPYCVSVSLRESERVHWRQAGLRLLNCAKHSIRYHRCTFERCSPTLLPSWVQEGDHEPVKKVGLTPLRIRDHYERVGPHEGRGSHHLLGPEGGAPHGGASGPPPCEVKIVEGDALPVDIEFVGGPAIVIGIAPLEWR
jgi:hypothetical protein